MSQTDDTPRTGATPAARLRWWTEIPLLAVVYGAYTLGRLLVRGDVDEAVHHGLALLRAEKALHLTVEHPLNRLFTREAWLGVPADFWYASLHYLVTPAILIWLFQRRAHIYRAARTWLMTSTLIGLIGFTLYPTCPPRLLPAGHGFVDTMAQYSSYGWWGGAASAPKGLGHMTNQYAAMPSLHVGWALWCGIMIWRHGRGPWAKVFGVLYPAGTAFVVIGSANHYVLDVLAGIAVMGVGLLLSKPVLRAADRVRAGLSGLWAPAGTPTGQGAPAPGATAGTGAGAGPTAGAAVSSASVAAPASIVSGECQTSTGERIPRQRKDSRTSGAGSPEPGGGAATTAR
ncbi:phosphatase PAP2 family protein [Streptomyces beihaiensis]|uniref:Phosphatase PAP2 family protein n=1 Tax=Streptomyces beihaiensis TaxID=2984495 RepID=A0ABT3TYP1_9ACTN|nr:phosphatase PAP2 family protein [Streptomyces beihaiensis]MCX3061180.1 phosphatase PAP2 family protein [Streptomyces beihaiensis]